MGEKIEFSDSMLDFRSDAKKLELFDKKIDKLKKSGFKKKKLLSVLNSELENTKTEESFYINYKETNKEEIEKDIKDISSYKERLKNLINDIEEGEEIENEIIDKSFLETAFSFDTEKMFKNIKISFNELKENIFFKKGSDFEKRKFEVSSFIQVGEDSITIVDQKVFDLIDGKDGIELIESEKYKLSDKEDSIYIEKIENSDKGKKNSVDEKEKVVNKKLEEKDIDFSKLSPKDFMIKILEKLYDSKDIKAYFASMEGKGTMLSISYRSELGNQIGKKIKSNEQFFNILDYKNELFNDVDGSNFASEITTDSMISSYSNNLEYRDLDKFIDGLENEKLLNHEMKNNLINGVSKNLTEENVVKYLNNYDSLNDNTYLELGRFSEIKEVKTRIDNYYDTLDGEDKKWFETNYKTTNSKEYKYD
ncbi:MAG: hypothetical protein Q9M94_04320 [Candidatus Gracilibacteria bacterium]|nr:hypothetical protein [Candidatus Gracilibacteria bacterium]